MMQQWGFVDDHGNELSCGYQGDECDARAVALQKANRIGAPVTYYDMAEPDTQARVLPDEVE